MWGEAIYLDNAAATRLDERVLEAMKPYLFETYAVATSEFGYSLGIEAREALEGARAAIAETLGAAAEEVIFTSGGAESSTLALKGVAAALGAKKGRHIVTTKLEDFPVLHSAQALERQGFEATYLEVDADGRLDPQRLREALRPDTVLVSVQAANQEIGTLQEIPTLAQVAHERGVLFHTDATHSYRRIPLDVQEAPVDLVTLSAHTLHGPKGVGALYVRKGTPLTRQVEGGFQELGLRGGLENIPGAVGFAEAARLATADETARLQGLRDRLTAGLLQIPHSRVNGHPVHRLPHNANISFRFVEGESVLLHLDMRGIAVSTGSACFSRSLEASHVIMAIGGNHERAHGSVRFTFGRFNRAEEVDVAAAAMSEVVERLRAISPLGKDDFPRNK